MKIKLGKFFARLFHGVNVGDLLVGALGRITAGDVEQLVADAGRAEITTWIKVNGRRYRAVVTFTPEE